MRQEQILFNKAINRVNYFLKLSGIFINDQDGTRSFSQRLFHRWFYCLNFVWMNSDACSWFIIASQLSVQENTYMVPCITLCFLGNFKSYYFISCHHHVIDLIKSLKNLQAVSTTGEVEEGIKKKCLSFLYLMTNILILADAMGILMFFVGPTLMILTHYLATKEVQLVLSFLVWYPFDAYDIRFWPFAFVHQFWSAWVCVFFVYGPDCFYFTCCAFVHLQFKSLLLDMEDVARTQGGREEFVALIQRHWEIARCVDILNVIYGKSTLFNAASSSLIICVTGFNIMAIDDLLITAPFTPFLIYGSLQIYLFCYYGDLLMQDSLDISTAVYNSAWYELDAADMKHCLFMLMRAQKPCKITAYGFRDINMRAFTKILSSSWSYFTLLMTMYGNKN